MRRLFSAASAVLRPHRCAMFAIAALGVDSMAI
jgi:hypothetical protein